MDYTSIKVGQLPTEEISGSDFIPHEVNGLLKKATITDLAAFIGANDAVGFRAVSVPNGGTLPTTDTQEFILVGPGTYNNVGGGSTITVTEELNALVSNGTYWFVGVEIPIDAPPGNAVWGEIVGTLSNQTDLQSLLNLKADLVAGKVPSSQLPSYVDDVVEVADFAALPVSGETGKIYVTLDSGFIYRWTGTIYVRIADEAAAWGTITGTLSDQTDLQSALNLRVPYTGATGNVDLGSHKLSASDLVVNHASGSGVAASITKGGNGEALTVVKSSGTGNAASITGGTTLISELNLTTDLADAYIASAATWNAKQNALSGTGFVKISGSTISYDNSTYALDSVVVKLTGDQNIRGVKSFLGNQTASTLKLVLADYFNDGFITSDNGMLRLLNGSTELFNLDSTGIVKGASYQLNGGTGNALYYGHTNKVVLANYTVGGGIDFETNGGAVNMILNSNGNLGIGVDPSAWDTAWKVLQLSYGSLYSSIYSNIMAHNLYVAGEDTKYISSNLASQYEQNSGAHWWYTAPSGTAGANVTLTPRMILDNGGNVGIGTTSPLSMLHAKASGYPTLTLEGSTNSGAGIRFFGDVQYAEIFGEYQSSGNGQMFFRTRNSGTISTAMTILGSGNVGIGTTSPTEIGGYTALTINNNSSGSFIDLNNSSTNNFRLLSLPGGDVRLISSSQLRFDTNGSERMRINSEGNVGIGIVPQWSLGTYRSLEIGLTGLIYARTTSDSGTMTVGSNLYYNGGWKYKVNGAGSLLGQNDGNITFETAPSGTSGSAASISERMRITSGGAVLVGTTADNGGKLTVSGGQGGGFRVEQNGGAISLPSTGLSFSTGYSVGYIRNANGSGSVVDLYIEAARVSFSNLGTGLVYSSSGFLTSTNPSDSRLKDNITDLQYGLNEILKLRPVSYNWKNDNINQGKQFGFIAQEVQEVMPELVKEFETEDGERLGLDKEGIYAALVNAIKELKAEIEILKNK